MGPNKLIKFSDNKYLSIILNESVKFGFTILFGYISQIKIWWNSLAIPKLHNKNILKSHQQTQSQDVFLSSTSIPCFCYCRLTKSCDIPWSFPLSSPTFWFRRCVYQTRPIAGGLKCLRVRIKNGPI